MQSGEMSACTTTRLVGCDEELGKAQMCSEGYFLQKLSRSWAVRELRSMKSIDSLNI